MASPLFFVFMLMVVLIDVTCAHIRQRQFRKPFDYNTALIDPAYNLETVKVRSILSCSQRCSHNARCRSFNYKKEKGGGVCQPNSRSFRELAYSTPPAEVAGFRYYEGVHDGLAYSSPAANCKVMKEQFPHAKSGSYWLDLDGGGHDNAFLGYCDMETGGGGWTLVYSYTFTLRPLASTAGDNQAVTPRPNWPINVGANTHTPVSTTPPTSETDYAAMEFNLWKTIGQEILIKSNLNHWISCTPATGNLLTWATGTMNCGVVKNVSSQCPGSAPSWFGTFQCGPSFQKDTGIFYYFDACTNTHHPVHDGCGTTSSLIGVPPNIPDPHGNIFVR